MRGWTRHWVGWGEHSTVFRIGTGTCVWESRDAWEEFDETRHGEEAAYAQLQVVAFWVGCSGLTAAK